MRVLIIPGLAGSGPEHWQTRWEKLDARAERVEQRDWDNPRLDEWLSVLDAHVRRTDEPTLLVAHSLGAVLVAHYSAEYAVPANVRGALLVAPPDVERADMPVEVRGFAPLRRAPLRMPSVLVASHDDPYCTFERARELARLLHSRFVDHGFTGHINASSGLGDWPAGRALLDELGAAACFALDGRLQADTVDLGESALSVLLLMNERRYPWLILVPKRADKAEAFELDDRERAVLWDESCLVARSLSEQFRPHKINVGALGNVVRQLHVHHVARNPGDPAWPGPVWGHSPRVPYAEEELERVREQLRASALARHFSVW